MINFLETNKTYYLIVWDWLNTRSGKMKRTGCGIFFPTRAAAKRKLDQVLKNHPNAHIITHTIKG